MKISLKNSITYKTTIIGLATIQPITQSWSEDLVDLIPSLYGGDGITLMAREQFSHEAHFLVDTQAAINQLNDQIASAVRPLPLTPSAGGITYRFDPDRGTYVQTTETLGPLITERPQTLGKGQISLGASFTFFDYDQFEGDRLSNLQVTAFHIPDTFPCAPIGPDNETITPCGNPNERENWELDRVNLDVDIDLDFKTWTLSAAYGVTDRLDLGILIPIVDVNMKVRSKAEIVVSPENDFPDVHSFGGEDDPIDSASDSDTGLGDILVGAKYFWIDKDRYDISGALRVKFGTGDEDNFQGTGSTTIRPFLIAAYKATNYINLRTNLGFDFDLDDSDRNEFIYTAGFDAGNQVFTGVIDLIGSHKIDGNGIGDDLVDVAFGLKWQPIKHLILATNLLVPINDNEGLRSNVITTFGLEFRTDY